MSDNTNSEIDPVLLTYHGKRRFTLPFVSEPDPSQPLPTHVIRPFQIHDYNLSPAELENEKPFMRGRVIISPEVLATRPIFPVHAREILSNEEAENERPFMAGRKKVTPAAAAQKAQAPGHLYDVLSDEEWENEHPFMHGRNVIPRNVVENRRYLQVTPGLSADELENERPFMHGRNQINPELEDRRHQRRIIDFFSDAEVELIQRENHKETEPKRKLRRQRRFQQNKDSTERKRLCTPCQKLNEFRKDTLVPAVKSVRRFMQTGAKSAKENAIVVKEVITSNEFKEVRTKLVKKSGSEHEDLQELRKTSDGSECLSSQLNEARKETVLLLNARRAERLKRVDSRLV